MNKTFWYKVWDKQGSRNERIAELVAPEGITKENLDELIKEEIEEYMHSCYQEAWNVEWEILSLPPADWVVKQVLYAEREVIAWNQRVAYLKTLWAEAALKES